MKENVFDIIDALSKIPQNEIEFALKTLMIEKKINFINISNAYIQSLEEINSNAEARIIEATTCIYEGFLDKKITKTSTNHKDNNYKHTQRCLYVLNKEKRFPMDVLNQEYRYDEEFGKNQTCTEFLRDNE